jgi:hypothetical protein
MVLKMSLSYPLHLVFPFGEDDAALEFFLAPRNTGDEDDE